MKCGRQGGLIAIGHFLFGRGKRRSWSVFGKRGRANGQFLLSLKKNTNTTLCSGRLPFSCQRTISVETSEYIVSLLLPWLCTILVQVLGCAHACVAPLCSLGMLNTSFAHHSCSLISYLLLPAAGSVSILRLRYRPNKPS